MKTLRVLLMSILFLDGRDLMAQQKEVKSLLQTYYEIKDALVAGDGDSASDRAEEFVRMMGEMPVNQLDAARQKSWKLRATKIRDEADKIGATFEGVLRDRLLVRDQRIPARLYSLVRQDLLGPLA